MRKLLSLTIALVALAIISISALVCVGEASAVPGNTCNPPAGHGNPGCHRAVVTTTTKRVTTTTRRPTTTTKRPTTTTPATSAPTTTTVAPTTTTVPDTTTTEPETTTTVEETTTTLVPETTTSTTPAFAPPEDNTLPPMVWTIFAFIGWAGFVGMVIVWAARR